MDPEQQAAADSVIGYALPGAPGTSDAASSSETGPLSSQATPGPADASAADNALLASVPPPDAAVGAEASVAAAAAPADVGGAAAAAASPDVPGLIKDAGGLGEGASTFLDAAKDAGSPLVSEDKAGKVGAALGLPGDIAKGIDGVKEMGDGQMLKGALDLGKGVFGAGKDVATLLGNGAADALGAVGKGLGTAGAVLNLAKDSNNIGQGIADVGKADNFSDGADGVLKTAGGITSFIGDGAKALGGIGVKGLDKIPGLNVAKGAIDVAQTGKDIYDIAADHDSLPGGQSRKDGTDATVDAVDHGLHAVSDIGGMAAGPVGAVAKAFGAGMDVGNVIAPYVFGDMKSPGTHTEKVQTNADGTEQKFHATTGNNVIDWIAGVGKYTDGRF